MRDHLEIDTSRMQIVNDCLSPTGRVRDHLEIDTARIHIPQTSRAKISKLRLLFGDECRVRAPYLAASVSLHHLSEPIGQEMFFDCNCSHAHFSFSFLSFLWQLPTIYNISP